MSWAMANSTPAAPVHDDQAGDVLVESRTKLQPPQRWKVLLHNDDYTTMDFVVYVLMKFFHKSPPEATHIMLHVHKKGFGVAGVYSRDVAETKVAQVTAEARANEMPLLTTTELE